MNQLRCQQLDVRIGKHLLIKGLNLDIDSGQCWAILGPNGSGKTTLLHTLAGLRPADSGEVQLQQRPISDYRRRELAQRVGVLFQHQEEGFASTVMETALIGRHPHLSAWAWESETDQQCALQSLREVEMEALAQRAVSSLSGGERQRLALATLFTQDPGLFLMDEPTNHLDLHHQLELLQRLREMAAEQGKALVMVLHDVNLAQRFCDHALLLMGDGEYLQGERDEVLNASNLSRLYRHPLQALHGPAGTVFVPQ